jgi:hypothetical protein
MATAQENPGKFQPYDPSTPYQAPAIPDPTPATPSPLPTQGPEINGAVKKSGAIATIADSILRGYMSGRAQHQASEVMKLKKKTDDLQNSYNQDAVRLYQLTAAGIDSNSDEYKAAKSSVDGSWGALMDFYGKHVSQDDGKKKSKAKKVEGGIVGALQSKDPAQVSQAWYSVAQKAGAPIYGQIATLNTPEAKQSRANRAAVPGLEAGQISHEQTVQTAQGTIDKLGPTIASFSSTPQSQWTDAQKQQYGQYRQAYDVVNPPKIPELKPGDETKKALDDVVGKLHTDPNYKLTEADREIFRANKITIDPKSKLHVTSRGELISEHEDGSYEILRGPQKAYASRGEGGSGGGGAEEKVYKKWDAYYKQHSPNLSPEERDALVRRKVEGAGQEEAGVIAHDNYVLSAAIDRMRSMPQYKDRLTSDKLPFNLDDALANLVYQGEDGYQYQSAGNKPKPGKDGKYSGDLTEEDLTNLERDLQTQIRVVLSGSKETALSSTERRAVMTRLQPLFGPAAAPQGGTVTPKSPSAGATPSAPPASSQAAPGGQSQFMAALNPKGLKEPGNLPIWNRPSIQNADGSHSSELSISMGDSQGREVLVPTIADGKFLTPDGKMPPLVNGKIPKMKDWDKYPPWKALKKAAWDRFEKTGENLGKFDTPGNADAYAETLHNRGQKNGGHKQSKGIVKKSAFLKANPGSTDADWQAIKPQLTTQGYDTKDE